MRKSALLKARGNIPTTTTTTTASTKRDRPEEDEEEKEGGIQSSNIPPTPPPPSTTTTTTTTTSLSFKKPFVSPGGGVRMVDSTAQVVDKRRKMLAISYKKGPTTTTTTTTTTNTTTSSSNVEQVEPRYFKCMYTKKSAKKHKTYEDGVIIVTGGVVKLLDMDAKELGKTIQYNARELSTLHAGNELDVGSRQLEVGAPIEPSEYRSGQVFRTGAAAIRVKDAVPSKVDAKVRKQFMGHKDAGMGSVERKVVELKPRYDPDAPNALILYQPPPERRGVSEVAVVVDPHLAKELRPHQRSGVQFLYDCVMGNRGYTGQGCILADEMGLGKTLQAVTLVWTLLKSGPKGQPVVRKAAIVTPSSLVRNWIKEFSRWLGRERVIPFSVDTAKNKGQALEMLEEFSRLAKHQVLIISYEMFRAHKDFLSSMEPALDLLMLDEGHRIKNVSAQISKALAQVRTPRRVLLTGTPLQNDLGEFYAMVDFCNKEILGTPEFFRRFYVNPIELSRDVSASDHKRREGEEKFAELAKITAPFMLRRTNQILEDYLPPKSEQVIFCRPSQAQVDLYRFFLSTSRLRSVLTTDTMSASSLECVSLLTKLCNYPGLVRVKAQEYLEESSSSSSEQGDRKKKLTLQELFGEDDEEMDGEENANPTTTTTTASLRVDWSGKLTVLDALLKSVRASPSTSSDKVVIVSNFTKTLDVVEQLFLARGWKWFRLDGQTAKEKRQAFVDSFNRPQCDVFAFLLSSKAGGTGLNLIGANRLILFDSDWNPATDRQAMARVWRDGQRKRVFLYRLLTTGTIDEKIWQRQLSKEGLSNSVLDSSFGKVQFSKADLKDIFSLSINTLCETHDLICNCWRKQQNKGATVEAAAQNAKFDISRWQHLCDCSKLQDEALRQATVLEPDAVSAVFRIDTDGRQYVAPLVAEAEEEKGDTKIIIDDDDDDAALVLSDDE